MGASTAGLFSVQQGRGLSLLVVEDDVAIAGSLVRGLGRAGYEVTHVATGEAALRAQGADLVILDLGLPDIEGLDVCSRLRARTTAAIVVVTARHEEPERVAALDAGADDYLVKPFGFAELLARLRAVLRRTQPEASGRLQHGALEVDLRARRVRVAGEEVALTQKEFDLLAALAEDPGRTLSRREILERAWDANWYGPSKVLDVHVAALRRKLARPGLIETVYGVGFRLGPE